MQKSFTLFAHVLQQALGVVSLALLMAFLLPVEDKPALFSAVLIASGLATVLFLYFLRSNSALVIPSLWVCVFVARAFPRKSHSFWAESAVVFLFASLLWWMLSKFSLTHLFRPSPLLSVVVLTAAGVVLLQMSLPWLEVGVWVGGILVFLFFYFTPLYEFSFLLTFLVLFGVAILGTIFHKFSPEYYVVLRHGQRNVGDLPHGYRVISREEVPLGLRKRLSSLSSSEFLISLEQWEKWVQERDEVAQIVEGDFVFIQINSGDIQREYLLESSFFAGNSEKFYFSFAPYRLFTRGDRPRVRLAYTVLSRQFYLDFSLPLPRSRFYSARSLREILAIPSNVAKVRWQSSYLPIHDQLVPVALCKRDLLSISQISSYSFPVGSEYALILKEYLQASPRFRLPRDYGVVFSPYGGEEVVGRISSSGLYANFSHGQGGIFSLSRFWSWPRAPRNGFFPLLVLYLLFLLTVYEVSVGRQGASLSGMVGASAKVSVVSSLLVGIPSTCSLEGCTLQRGAVWRGFSLRIKRGICVAVSVLLLLVGCWGKLSAFFLSIPRAVLGLLLFFMAFFLFCEAVEKAKGFHSRRESFIWIFSLLLGVGGAWLFRREFLFFLPKIVQDGVELFLGSPISLILLSCLFLDFVFPRGKEGWE
ncbi:MAG: hypothetical protein D6805_08275 [Planctomycetota bacterium]|nr:MAG: hypothetical protein D6805_08275 [Planctomycetota bacterium]